MNWYKKAQSSPAPFLETPEMAWEWAQKNIDIDVDEDSLEDVDEDSLDSENNNEEAIFQQYLRRCLQDLKDKAMTYSEKYNAIKNMPSVTIYRAIRIKGLEDIQWDKIGTHWSFDKKGAGVYGYFPPGYHNKQETQDVVLTGVVEPKYIDWEYCFTSFMYYGEDQWECALDDGAPVKVTHINDSPVNIEANA